MNKPVRVLFLIPGDGRGSSMIFVRRQAESLAKEGLQVRSFYLASRTSPVALAREFVRFRRELASFRPDVVHAHFGSVTAMFAAVACGNRPLVITYRGSDLNRSPVTDGCRARLARLLSQLAALRAQRIVCVSRQLQQRLWWRRRRAIVLPSGFDAQLFRPEPREAARKRLGWEMQQRVVLFNAGYDRRNKRLDLAEQAAAIARKTWPDLRLEVLNGATDPARMPWLMNSSDCLLVTSESEGSPTVVQEALACGLPVVSVDVGDIAERLAGVAHTCIVSRRPEVIGRALADCTAKPVRSNGPESAQQFSSQRIAQRLKELYLEMRTDN